MLQAGISALRSGDKARAKAIFAQLVKENPLSEQGWYLLGMSVASLEQREYCYKRVLAINPNNQDAKKQLALLTRPAPVPSPLDRLSHLEVREEQFQQPATSNTVSGASEPYIQPVSPFAYEDLKSDLIQEEKAAPVSVDPASKNEKRKRKTNSNRTILISMTATLFFGVCVFSLAFLLFPQTFRQLLSPIFPQQNQVLLPTQTMAPLVLTTDTPIPPTAIPSAMPTVAYTPRYEETPCSFETPARVKVTCGFVTVPEDRTGDPSKTIRLAVAVFHSTSDVPAPDPVMFLQGGPGGEAVQLSAAAFDVLVAPFLSKRDYVTFDQRGTGLSEPALKCDELDKVYRQDIYGTIPGDTRELVYKNAFLSCGGFLQVNGVELNSYTTTESAADLKDILNLLGYSKVNLYGASYGTRLALVTMRNHPEIVKTAILDSVVPVEANVFNQYPDSVDSALSQLFDTCAADIKCNSAYPDLKTTFWDLVKELNTNPVTVTTSAYPMGTVTESVDGGYLLNVVLGSIKSSSFIETAPQTIYRVKGKDYSTLLAVQYSLPYAFDGINAGLYISMMCHEHGLAVTTDGFQNVSKRLGVEHIWRPFYGAPEEVIQACTSWGTTGPYLGENDAVRSDIPSLIIEGSYDPATPPFFGKQVAVNLPNSFYVEFPNQGHVPTAADPTGCAMEMAVAFLENPLVDPDRGCLTDLPKIEYLVPYTADPPLELIEEDIFGVRVDIPADWFFTFDGFFIRGTSAFDITQVAALRASLSVAELQDYFSLSAYGYRGLDGAPVEAGTRNANGLDWKLYIATSNGRPVDIAAADDGGTSLIIMMFSHADEHDALYRTVFLPMVDSAR
jgi:pimeloyl-ACP methyl ester carboxylesterase